MNPNSREAKLKRAARICQTASNSLAKAKMISMQDIGHTERASRDEMNSLESPPRYFCANAVVPLLATVDNKVQVVSNMEGFVFHAAHREGVDFDDFHHFCREAALPWSRDLQARLTAPFISADHLGVSFENEEELPPQTAAAFLSRLGRKIEIEALSKSPSDVLGDSDGEELSELSELCLIWFRAGQDVAPVLPDELREHNQAIIDHCEAIGSAAEAELERQKEIENDMSSQVGEKWRHGRE